MRTLLVVSYIILVPNLANAEEARGGMRSFLTVNGGVIWADNPELSDLGDRAFEPLVELRFGLTTETRRQSLA